MAGLKDFLLFTSDGDGEYYEGAYSTLELAKAIAFKRWDGDAYTSYTVRKTSNRGFSLSGATEYHKDAPYLKWSDETIKDIGYQKEKRDNIKARREREAEESAKIRRRIEEKQARGEKLTLSERMQVSIWQTQGQMLATLLNQQAFPWPDGQSLVSTTPSTGGQE